MVEARPAAFDDASACLRNTDTVGGVCWMTKVMNDGS